MSAYFDELFRICSVFVFFFQAEDGIRDLVRSRGLGDVYKRQALAMPNVYINEDSNFVGIGRNSRISGNEVFGVRYSGGANDYGGMYVETAHPNGWPFYGYATNGSFRAWTYYNLSLIHI